MAVTLDDKLVVAISSRALFDFEEENRVFDPLDPRAYYGTAAGAAGSPSQTGVAFQLVKKLLAFNTAHARNVEVVILSRNDPVSALRIFARPKRRAAPGAGVSPRARPFRYLRPLGRTCFCRPTSRT